jgi:peptide/nickel transport system ATP-binding protein
MSEANLLEVENLAVSFRSDRGLLRAVSDVSFSVAPREIVGVVGESGSGKTLSLMAVMGLIRDPNVSITGSIRFMGQDLLKLSPRGWRAVRGNKIAMIFQDPMTALTPVYTIGWQISEQVRAHTRMSARAATDRTVELLAEMGMPNPRVQAERYPHQLSGGMRQRAMIAMALSCNPVLLIADEPTTALDVTVQAQILGLLRRLRETHGSSIVLITHDMGVVAEIADRVMVMYGGRIVERADRADIFAHPGHPYTMGLLDSIPPMHGARPRRLPSIPGSPPPITQLPQGCPFQPRCPYRHDRCAEMPPLFVRGRQEMACWLADERADWPAPRALAGLAA